MYIYMFIPDLNKLDVIFRDQKRAKYSNKEGERIKNCFMSQIEAMFALNELMLITR